MIVTSELVKHTCKASIEEVEDEDNIKTRSKKTLLATRRYTYD